MTATVRIVIGLILMAASNGVAWHMIVTSSKVSLSAFRSAITKIALFHTLWALYNRYPGGRDDELGHFSFGILFLTCVGQAQYCKSSKNPILVKAPLMAAGWLVVLNFSAVFPLMMQSGGPLEFAKLVWGVQEDGDELSLLVKLWALVYSAYSASNLVLWSYSQELLSKMHIAC